MNGFDVALLVSAIVLVWVVQIILSYRQAIGMSHRIADLRRKGTVAVGLGRGRLRSRTYAVVSVDRNDRVTDVEVLRGWTSFSRPRPIPNLAGVRFEQLCDTGTVSALDAPLQAALCQVVETIRADRSAKKGEGGAAIAQRA